MVFVILRAKGIQVPRFSRAFGLEDLAGNCDHRVAWFWWMGWAESEDEGFFLFEKIKIINKKKSFSVTVLCLRFFVRMSHESSVEDLLRVQGDLPR